jgi:hypothetical protein
MWRCDSTRLLVTHVLAQRRPLPFLRGGASNIWEQPIAGGAAKQLTHFTSETGSLFDLSKDGKQLAIQRDTSSSNVVLIHDVK